MSKTSNKKKKIIIGTRGSLLSVCQAEEVTKLLKSRFPRYRFSLKKITTLGDRLKNWQRQDKGIFVKEIEEALLSGKIDVAIHSLKDLPIKIPSQLKLAAVTKRLDPSDVLIVKDKRNLFNLETQAIVGTGSLRRKSQLLHWRPDLKIKNLRGNLDTRIKKLKNGEFDAIVVAACGLKRLGYNNLFFKPLSTGVMLPAAGQGAIGIQIRKKDKVMAEIAKKINDLETFLCISCERAFLKALGGGCRLPQAALAKIKNDSITLEAAVISLDGKKIIRVSKKIAFGDDLLRFSVVRKVFYTFLHHKKAPLEKAEELGRQVARIMLKKGAQSILDGVKKQR